MCARERERQKEIETKRQRDTERQRGDLSFCAQSNSVTVTVKSKMSPSGHVLNKGLVINMCLLLKAMKHLGRRLFSYWVFS